MGSLVLVRHSITAAAAEGRNLGQRGDPPLAEEGVALAERLAIALVAELRELVHTDLRVVSSPALRCRQTVAPVLAAIGVDPGRMEVVPALIELAYGAWEGLTADECRRRDPQHRAAWEADPYEVRCPDGESGSDVARRSFPVLEEVESWLAEDRARVAVVVAHNHVNRLRLCAHLGFPMAEYRDRIAQDPAGYSLLTFGGRTAIIRRLNAPPA